ncbi:succinate dehydrogenase subunit 7B, mitochondrial-like [Quercus lobata]|uniref:succinate dehydrogenase subunit 7B, mitochondrial-like n=1 Tax=Quercus lobata TaxID=97700 RepID=UPI001247C324|nr:succinate dehydrogenase subunit 7B, mitochondrial-like [Quercus lobata]
MAFLLNKTSIASHFRSHSSLLDSLLSSFRSSNFSLSLSLEHSGRALSHSSRLPHRTQSLQLLAEDPALKRFKSHKKSVNAVKRMGDVLTLVVVAVMKPMVSLKHFIGFLPSLSRIWLA